MSYFSFIDGGIYRTPEAKDPKNGEEYEDIDVNQNKLIADFHDVDYWELLGTFNDVDYWQQIGVNSTFTIYWNIDTQRLLIVRNLEEEAWESDFISLLNVSKTEREEFLIELADACIAGLMRMLKEDEAIKLQTPLFQLVS